MVNGGGDDIRVGVFFFNVRHRFRTIFGHFHGHFGGTRTRFTLSVPIYVFFISNETRSDVHGRRINARNFVNSPLVVTATVREQIITITGTPGGGPIFPLSRSKYLPTNDLSRVRS